MTDKITLDLSKTKPYLNEHETHNLQQMIDAAHHMLHNKTGSGSDFLGWIDLPINYDKAEFQRIQKAAEKIKKTSEVLVVIGIGGSYLGARAAIEMLNHSFYGLLPNNKKDAPVILFAGNNISSTYMSELLEAVEGKDISVNVISKSGTTTEPAIAFRIFKDYWKRNMVKKEQKKEFLLPQTKRREH